MTTVRVTPAPLDVVEEGIVEEHRAATLNALGQSGPALHRAASWGRRLAGRLPAGRRLLVCGNGGSAAEAQHLTAEMVGRFRYDRPPFSAISLHAETSSLTAIANDYGVQHMFARQVEAHARAGDVLILLSTSGHSENLLEAAERAARLGVTTWAMTGPVPNPLAQICDEVAVIHSSSTSAIQEVQLVAIHILCATFDAQVRRTS